MSEANYLIGSKKYTIKVTFFNVPNMCNFCKKVGHLFTYRLERKENNERKRGGEEREGTIG